MFGGQFFLFTTDSIDNVDVVGAHCATRAEIWDLARRIETLFEIFVFFSQSDYVFFEGFEVWIGMNHPSEGARGIFFYFGGIIRRNWACEFYGLIISCT